MKSTLQWVDSSNGQLDGASNGQRGEHGRKGGERTEEGNLVFRESLQLFMCPQASWSSWE